mgnify:CR=1 FL=1
MTERKTGDNNRKKDDQLPELLRELASCGHHGARLLERTGLPVWARGPLFQLMGFVAKADGRVTELDIRYCESLMRNFGCSSRQRRRLIRRFSAGKRAQEPAVPLWLRLFTRRWPGTAYRLSIALAHLCFQDGPPSPARKARCQNAMLDLDLPASDGTRILQSYQSKVWITSPDEGTNEPLTGLARACQVVGGKPSDSLEELRQAYRKQRSLYHPDRVQHTDMDPQLARTRLEEIHKAWDLINRRHPEA